MHTVHGISIISEKGIFLSSFFLFHTNNKFPTVITSLIMLRSMLVVTLCKLNDVHISGSALTMVLCLYQYIFRRVSKRNKSEHWLLLCFYFLRKRYLYSRGITINSTNDNVYETFVLFDKVDTVLVK